MASSFTGPLFNAVKSNGNREWFNSQPISANEPDYFKAFYDWVQDSQYDTTNDFTETKDAGASVAAVADTDGGELKITSAATTDNDGGLVQEAQMRWSLSSGKQMWFEARVKVSDADQQDFFVGIATDAAITNPEDILTQADRCGFQINDGDASILAKAEKNGTETSTDTGNDAADDTYVQLGFHWDGINTVSYFVNRSRVAKHTTNIPDDVQMGAAWFELSGDAVGTKSSTCDYVAMCQER